ncbi:putative Two-component system regulatory protein [Frankia alni ACN14a]|uniref:Two-component system regulatory protein n=1 Tax=Frankia alni (strain DSM 45986 / CECT 9034 / ACN14a) TaxID=326424 RepID=Q0RR82_FRAAA|nr:putative Two-component system regulatory protein [Frankia alni ACN14a]
MFPRAEDVAWFGATDPSAAGAARRAAVTLAGRLGFPATRGAELGIAVTETMTNLVRHSDDGRLLLRVLRWDGDRTDLTTAVQFVAIDSGPGMADVSAAMRDGATSAGTLGVGLGAIARLSDDLDIHSTPGRGTAMVVTFRPTGRPGPRPGTPGPPGLPSGGLGAPRVAGLTRPITGETVCGDAYAVRATDAGLALLLCDGLGHGELAARAAREAVRIFLAAADPSGGPVELVRRIHQGISHTRGAAVAVAVLEPAAEVLRFAGLGNVAGVILSGARRSGLLSRPGIAGHQARGLSETRHPLPGDALVVLHSDGVGTRWNLADHPGVASHDPLLVAATILRDAGLRRDDASVVVAGPPQAAG